MIPSLGDQLGSMGMGNFARSTALFSILFLFLFSSISFAANWTIEGDSVVWNNSIANIRCNAYSTGLINQEQVCEFDYFGSASKTLNSSFVFNKDDGVTPKAAYLWRNISHVAYHMVEKPVYHSWELSNVSSIKTTSGACDFGAETCSIKRNVTADGNSSVHCFDSWVNDSGEYTLSCTYLSPVSETYPKYYFDWAPITGLFEISKFGNYVVGTIQSTWVENQSREVKFEYLTEPGTQGKFDIYFHTGSAQEAKADPSKIILKLDPWWGGSSWDYKRQVNLTSGVNSTLTDFPAHFILDTQSLIGNGSMQGDCDDLRVINSSEDGSFPLR